jgi:hypothetical protein
VATIMDNGDNGLLLYRFLDGLKTAKESIKGYSKSTIYIKFLAQDSSLHGS